MKRACILFVVLAAFAMSGNAQNGSRPCYRGHFDVGYSIGIGDYDLGRFEISTSHGCQFNPYLYLGLGVGFHFMSSYETKDMDIPLDVRDSQVDIPMFANIRCNFSKKKVSPFVDVKGGSYVTNNGGVYACASVGCRFSLRGKQALSIAAGYTLGKLEFETFNRFTNTNYTSYTNYSSYSNYTRRDYTRIPSKNNTEAITLRVGFEF